MVRYFALLLAPLALFGTALAQETPAGPGVPCEPVARCADGDAVCAAEVRLTGNVLEPETGRAFFLDYGCDIDPGEEVIFILNVHGIGGNANWQRHYFPALDYKDVNNLVIATGKSRGISFNAEADDDYVRGMIQYVADAFPNNDIYFWVAGHSAGGAYSRSWLCKPSALQDRAVGSVSLAGNRVGGMGSALPIGAGAAAAGRPLPPGATRSGPPPGAGRGPGGAPSCGQFSHIYSTGDQDSLGGNPVPATSTLAEDLGCGDRLRRADIVDTAGGHVYDARDRPAPLPGWGGVARPGTTQVFEFPGCEDGRVVADLIRLDKGHTEGLEPQVTEQIIRYVVRATGL